MLCKARPRGPMRLTGTRSMSRHPPTPRSVTAFCARRQSGMSPKLRGVGRVPHRLATAPFADTSLELLARGPGVPVRCTLTCVTRKCLYLRKKFLSSSRAYACPAANGCNDPSLFTCCCPTRATCRPMTCGTIPASRAPGDRRQDRRGDESRRPLTPADHAPVATA